ncbi:methyltransferase domain-containing protein [Candidatus Gottesmanbacteria bacterium]|nr:methyltransferase domain-containing protein [Candidatus Gottesmanbacteria bacterium]
MVVRTEKFRHFEACEGDVPHYVDHSHNQKRFGEDFLEYLKRYSPLYATILLLGNELTDSVQELTAEKYDIYALDTHKGILARTSVRQPVWLRDPFSQAIYAYLINNRLVKFPSTNHHARYHAVMGRQEYFPFARSSFDAIGINEYLRRLTNADALAYLISVRRLLKPNGIAFLHDTISNKDPIMQDAFSQRVTRSWVMRALLETAGYALVTLITYPHPHDAKLKKFVICAENYSPDVTSQLVTLARVMKKRRVIDGPR